MTENTHDVTYRTESTLQLKHISPPPLLVFTSPPLHLLPFMFAIALFFHAHKNPVERTKADAFPAKHSTPEVSVYIKHQM